MKMLARVNIIAVLLALFAFPLPSDAIMSAQKTSFAILAGPIDPEAADKLGRHIQETYKASGYLSPSRPTHIRISGVVDSTAKSAAQTQSTIKERSERTKILGAIVGATGGFFVGGFLGAKIEGDRCNCDDPGLLGFLVGAPIGAATGGILGYKFLF